MLLSAQTISRESSKTMTPPEPAIDPQAARESKSIGISSMEISRSIVDPSACFSFILKRSSARRTLAELHSTGHFIDELAHGYFAYFDLEITRPHHVAADTNNPGTGIARRTEPG